MAKYIDAEKAIEEIKNICPYYEDLDDNYELGYSNALRFAIVVLREAPPVNIKVVIHEKPVLHAKKVCVHSKSSMSNFFVCSNCDESVDFYDNFCKRCGAGFQEDVGQLYEE